MVVFEEMGCNKWIIGYYLYGLSTKYFNKVAKGMAYLLYIVLMLSIIIYLKMSAQNTQ